jgi:hypothetical protein
LAEITKFPLPEDYEDWKSFGDGLIDVLSKHLGSIPSVPVGHIILYGGSLPQGYLPCNGVAFSSATYPALANRLGSNITPNIAGVGGFSYGIRAR